MKPTTAALDFAPALEKKLLGWIVVAVAVVTLLAAAIHSNAREGESLAEQERRAEIILYGGAGVNIALLTLAFCVVRMSRKSRSKAMAVLEAKVRERTAELNAVNQKLQIESIENQWGQAALERTVNHHERVLNSIQDGIFVISRNGRIISANAAAADLSRKEAKQLAGKSIVSVLLNGEDSPRDWDAHFLAELIREGKAIPGRQARLKQADGSILPVQIACNPTRDRENLTGAVVTVRAHSAMQ